MINEGQDALATTAIIPRTSYTAALRCRISLRSGMSIVVGHCSPGQVETRDVYFFLGTAADKLRRTCIMALLVTRMLTGLKLEIIKSASVFLFVFILIDARRHVITFLQVVAVVPSSTGSITIIHRCYTPVQIGTRTAMITSVVGRAKHTTCATSRAATARATEAYSTRNRMLLRLLMPFLVNTIVKISIRVVINAINKITVTA